MRVAILGTGGAALGYAAMLFAQGHQAALYSFSGAGIRGLRDKTVTATGSLDLEFFVEAHKDLALAVRNADGIIIASPANRHRRLIERLAPLLSNGQHVLVSAELSMSAGYLVERARALEAEISVTSLATTLMLGRRTGESSVAIGGLRQACDAWSWPPEDAEETLNFWSALYGDVFVPAPSHYTIALSNLNPPAHMANALCNFTRIEKGESWANYDGITESVARLIECLDVERLRIAEAFGVRVRSVEDHYRLSFGLGPGMRLAQMAAAVHERRKGPPGPTDVQTRFVTEDIPFGIAFIEHLGQTKSVPTPIHSAGITVFSALYGQDFRLENDLIATR